MNSQTVYPQIREISSGAELGYRAGLTPVTLELKKFRQGEIGMPGQRERLFPSFD